MEFNFGEARQAQPGSSRASSQERRPMVWKKKEEERKAWHLEKEKKGLEEIPDEQDRPFSRMLMKRSCTPSANESVEMNCNLLSDVKDSAAAMESLAAGVNTLHRLRPTNRSNGTG